MTAQFARAPHTSGRPQAPLYNAPHAALLIDFDNVTMGIRSDLTKELKSLLNSDIIKGKVAVQRAYADWRRYPQYIVPLAENSVDLIFAPAYGSSKKNATDIRLSIDALELVFTRPEIGTFILLSGDSDFSSLVLKLKEYGKYVIGVGIRESASDLLVQNCDEYYSYSALTGLTKAGDEELKQWDPWEAVEIAVQRMAEHDDVMRSDRLKQVILELDPNFDEKALGFTKFNRFLQEAANRGLLELHKLENGQFEVAPVGAAAAPEPIMEPLVEEAVPEERPARPRRERGRGRERAPRGRGEEAAVEREHVESAQPPKPAMAQEPASAAPLDVRGAYELLRAAVRDLTQGNGAARDSDVKRRILELNPDWSEPALGFSKFSRFLRQAHDAEVINLRKLENGNYEVSVAGSEPPPEASGGRGRGRGRGRSETRGRGDGERPGRGSSRGGRERTHSQLELSTVAPVAAPRVAAPLSPVRAAAAPAAPLAPVPAAQAGLGMRGGSRRRSGAAGPPPLLPGQTPGTAEKKPAQPAAPQQPEAAAPPSAPVFPKDAASVVNKLVGYKGVGRKTAEAAIEAFGISRLFDVLQKQPDRVVETLGTRRAQPLLDGFRADFEKQSQNAAQETPAHKRTAAGKTARGSRGGQSRRGRSGAPKA